MAQLYKNFYENAKEANFRLRNTVIWYHGPGEEGPYYVMCVCVGSSSDECKIYMKRLGQKYITDSNYLPPNEHIGSNVETIGPQMDEFMAKYPKMNIIRKDLSSPHFRAFRPFPLGMMNLTSKGKGGETVACQTMFIERQPLRSNQQGLVKQMLYKTPVNSAVSNKAVPAQYDFDFFHEDFYACCMGDYPSIDTCISKLTDPTIANEAAAFHRYFALVRGPVNMLFLAYKGEIVGVLDNRNLTSITVDGDKKYTKEAIRDLQVFHNIRS